MTISVNNSHQNQLHTRSSGISCAWRSRFQPNLYPNCRAVAWLLFPQKIASILPTSKIHASAHRRHPPSGISRFQGILKMRARDSEKWLRQWFVRTCRIVPQIQVYTTLLLFFFNGHRSQKYLSRRSSWRPQLFPLLSQIKVPRFHIPNKSSVSQHGSR